jgi:serine/threonine protein kinase
MVSSIEYLHQNSICHRDIKPENILYDQKNKKIKIIDFEISKKLVVNGLKRDLLTIVGSSYYFAPEIYLGGGYDEKIDLWSLGITIFKMITGYTPFES